MTDPIGTAQERELMNYLCRSTASAEEEQAADALLSRIAEVERLELALRESREGWANLSAALRDTGRDPDIADCYVEMIDEALSQHDDATHNKALR